MPSLVGASATSGAQLSLEDLMAPLEGVSKLRKQMSRLKRDSAMATCVHTPSRRHHSIV